MKNKLITLLLSSLLVVPLAAKAEVSEIKVPLGAGGFGFLPLHIMRKNNLIEKHAEKMGVPVKVNWSNIGGPSAMIDALISGSADFISAGPPSFLILWDRTKGNVRAAAAMSSMPMNINTKAEHLKSIDDLRPNDRIAVTSVKSSIPSIIMQMYAVQKYGKDQAFRFDPFTVTMNHGDAAAALLSGSGAIVAHAASAPLDQLERKTPGFRSILNTDDIMGGSTTFTMISTRSDFPQKNPKVYAAFLEALKEAQALIANDKGTAAEILIESMGGGSRWSKADMMEILSDPRIKYTTKPENLMKYANFMNDIGSIKTRPNSVADLFVVGADVSGGN